MTRYFIEDVKYGEAEGGMACGPVDGAIIAEVKVKTDDGEEFFMSLAEVMGTPCLAKTAVSTFDGQMEMADDAIDLVNEGSIEDDEYEDILCNPEHPEWLQLYRLLIYLVRECDTEEFIENAAGKYVDELDIPESDVEEELEWEEDEEEEV